MLNDIKMIWIIILSVILSLVIAVIAYYIGYLLGWFNSDNQCEDEIEKLKKENRQLRKRLKECKSPSTPTV